MRRTPVSTAVLGAATAVLLVFGTAAGCNTNGPGGAGGGSGGAANNGNGSDTSGPNEAPSGLTTSAPTPQGGGQQTPLAPPTSQDPATGN